MCLLIFAHQVSTRYPLVIAANRDEFHARPTAASEFWADYPDLLAGRDLEQGGTWMGVSRWGRFAAVTNYRDPSRTAPAPRSRGELALQFLTGDRPPGDFLADAANRAREYAGFNLLLGDRESLWHFTNDPGADDEGRCLAPGIYGLSNASLDTPWPKVELGKARLQRLLDNGPPSHDSLAAVVADRLLADPAELSGHGLDNSMDHLLSAQFIVTQAYGTRSSTTLWHDNEGRCNWREQSFDSSGQLAGECLQAFSLR